MIPWLQRMEPVPRREMWAEGQEEPAASRVRGASDPDAFFKYDSERAGVLRLRLRRTKPHRELEMGHEALRIVPDAGIATFFQE
jgi:hypothetical protein